MSTEGNSGNERRPDKVALIVAAGLAVVGGVIALQTSQMGGAGGYARIGPTTFPYVIAFCMIGLALWTAIEAVRGEFPAREPQVVSPVLWIVGGLVAQMILLRPLGFAIATGILFAATARGLGRGPLWLTVPVGIVIAFAVWYLFAKGLQLSLPSGDVWARLSAPAGS